MRPHYDNYNKLYTPGLMLPTELCSGFLASLWIFSWSPGVIFQTGATSKHVLSWLNAQYNKFLSGVFSRLEAALKKPQVQVMRDDVWGRSEEGIDQGPFLHEWQSKTLSVRDRVVSEMPGGDASVKRTTQSRQCRLPHTTEYRPKLQIRSPTDERRLSVAD